MPVGRIVLTLLTMSIAVLGFQNCSKMDVVSNSSNASDSAVPIAVPTATVTVYSDVRDQVFSNKCASCHADFMTYSTLMAHGYIVASQPSASTLFQLVTAGTMPQGGPSLGTADLSLIQAWIADGALESSAATSTPTPVPIAATFTSLNTNIFAPICLNCHSGASPGGGFDMSSYQGVMTRVFSTNPGASLVYTYTAGNPGPPAVPYSMPLGGAQLSAEQLSAIKSWINAGAPNN